jgi:hypothetical protein
VSRVRPCPFEMGALFGPGTTYQCRNGSVPLQPCACSMAGRPTEKSIFGTPFQEGQIGVPGQGMGGIRRDLRGAGRWGRLPASERTGLNWTHLNAEPEEGSLMGLLGLERWVEM